jgi:hypothetical protein
LLMENTKIMGRGIQPIKKLFEENISLNRWNLKKNWIIDFGMGWQ